MILRLLKVQGDSLSPLYQDGDYVLCSRIPILFRLPRPGEVVVFRHRVYGLLIKQVERVEPDARVFVTGLRAESIDSRVFGSIAAADIAGKVVLHVRKPAH